MAVGLAMVEDSTIEPKVAIDVGDQELHGAYGSTQCRPWQLCEAHGDAIDMTWLSPHKGCWCWQEEDAN